MSLELMTENTSNKLKGSTIRSSLSRQNPFAVVHVSRTNFPKTLPINLLKIQSFYRPIHNI